jgi:hypothetical protein
MTEATPPVPDDDVAVLTIGARSFVTGLRWQNMRSSAHYMDEARSFGRENHMDIVAIRVSKVIQAGFVAKARGVDRSMYSAAAVLIDTLGQSWLAAFDLGDGRFYLVAADKDAIVPDPDRVIAMAPNFSLGNAHTRLLDPVGCTRRGLPPRYHRNHMDQPSLSD